jgi:hypothetical protein
VSLRFRSDVVGGEQRALAFHESFNALGLIAFLFRDQPAKELGELVDADADDAAALSHEARQKAEAELLADIVAQERIESEAVRQAQAQGLAIEHRSDVPPEAVLGVTLVTKPNGHLPETSPGHAYDIVRPSGR